jgi:glycosyltransferase involved in cell wall biosynthesis
MKIVFLARLFSPHIGGVEKHVMQISKHLQKKGHDIIVITEQFDSSLPLHETIEGISVYRINKGKNDWFQKFRLWKEMFRLRSVIQSGDVIHCHDVFFWYLPLRFFYFQKPVYTTFHGYESFPIKKKAIVMRKLSEKLSYGNICIGDFIPKWYGTKATYISYGAVDTVSLSTVQKDMNKQSAFFFGRLDAQTGIYTYTEAYKILKKKFSAFSYLVMGDGEDKKFLSKDIKHLPFQKHPEKYFSKYHFVFVSRYLSILESLIAKKIVIAVYDNPVKEDYLRLAPFAKYIVIEKDPEKIAERVSYYLQHPSEEKKMIEAGYQWAKKQTWEKMIHTYLSLWKRNK